jgi:hypothetical protein
VSWRLARGLLIFTIVIVVWEYFAGVVVVVVVVTTVVGNIVNAGEVGGMSADMTDVTI